MVGMNKNLPIEEQTGLLGKIKSFFRRLFFKTSKNNNEIINKNVFKEQFNNILKVEDDNNVQKEKKRNKLFEKIINNQNLLNYLTKEQLKKFNAYGNKVIQKNDEIIKEKELELEKLKKIS